MEGMDADYRQYGKPRGNGCCWAIVWISLFLLGILALHINAFAVGLWRPDYDAITPDEEPRYWAGIAIEAIVLASILAVAIMRLRKGLKQYHPFDQRRFVRSYYRAVILISALGLIDVAGIVSAILYFCQTEWEPLTLAITIAIDVIILTSALAWAIVRLRRIPK
jgi:hypothetical protein